MSRRKTNRKQSKERETVPTDENENVLMITVRASVSFLEIEEEMNENCNVSHTNLVHFVKKQIRDFFCVVKIRGQRRQRRSTCYDQEILCLSSKSYKWKRK